MKVLLIEDYAPLRKSIAKGLHQAGFVVDMADNGKDGLWLAGGNDYDALILDMMLPGMDGLSLLRELRQKGKDTNVLILTARDTVPDRVEGLNAGADDYLVKPFAFEELLARIHALIRRRYQQKDPIIVIGELRIDTVSRRVWRSDTEVEFTRREFALLQYLARRPGHIVTRHDIWEHLYDFNDTSASNVVDVYIGYLRKKIDPSAGPSMIRTIRGRGYVMEAPP